LAKQGFLQGLPMIRPAISIEQCSFFV